MITVNNLKKNYGDVAALKGVSFSVEQGEIIGLLGPNGAGKTTLMKIITGYLHPTDGEAIVASHNVLHDPERVQELIGYLPENAPLYPELTVQGHLLMMADLRNIPEADKIRYISDAVYATGLEDRLTKPVGTLSKGYRQRVGLAQAILHKPKFLILDEPTNGLDPRQILEVRALIKKLAETSTVIVSSHILSEVEATCNRVIIIIDGSLKKDARLADLARTSNVLVSFQSNADLDAIGNGLKGIETMKNFIIRNRSAEHIQLQINSSSDDDICPQIFQLASNNQWPLTELKRETRTLETVFNEVTAGGVQ